MVINKPSIFIYTNQPDERCLKEICAGIEEEGVFYEVFDKEASDLDTLAFDAANESMMGSGIGLIGKSVALQMLGITKGNNIEICIDAEYSDCRRIGADSARIIKKLPLKLI